MSVQEPMLNPCELRINAEVILFDIDYSTIFDIINNKAFDGLLMSFVSMFVQAVCPRCTLE